MTDRSGEPETSEPGRTVVASDRFNKFEYPTGDFPYYNGVPVRISGLQWWFVIGMVVIGYLVLIAPVRAFAGGIGQFIPAILFPAIPLLGLAIVTPAHWTAIFRQVRGRDVLWMVVFALLNTVVTLAVGMVALKVLGVDRNPGLAGLSALSASELVLFYLKTAPHLFGEEILTILPFLALMYFLVSRMHLTRRLAIVLAWLVTAVIFGLVHLPTYNWNLAQVLLLIGLARLVLTLPYIMTKNLWVSTGAHILNDWTFFAVTILGASLPRG